ncbi:transposase [Pseudoalteromonas sp. SG43-7]|nr:transposase [Pseudoalteromonas sp. SG43-7]MBB1424829.1 transposase [Pseudoalteromonas sp. SG43-7]
MRRRFTQEFKVQAVEKALSQCDDVRLEDIADDLGVNNNRKVIHSTI